jgi:histone H3/H4
MRRSYLDDGPGRASLASGRTSDIRPERAFEDDTELTFVLPVPQRDSLSGRPSIGNRELNEDEEEQDDEVSLVEEVYEHESENADAEGDVSMQVPMHLETEKARPGRKKGQPIKKRAIKVSRYGIQYNSLPVGVVKKMATTFLRTSGFSKANLNKDTLEAIMQASDWFFEQVSEDLGTYAEHAGRKKTIDETDVITLMKR